MDFLIPKLPAKVAADVAYQNATKHSDRQNARIEHDRALARVMMALLRDDTKLFKEFSHNDSFRRWLNETIFGVTHLPGNRGVAPPGTPVG